MISGAMAQQDQPAAAREVVTQAAPVRVGDPYLENVCPVSGEALEGSDMGGPVTKVGPCSSLQRWRGEVRAHRASQADEPEHHAEAELEARRKHVTRSPQQ